MSAVVLESRQGLASGTEIGIVADGAFVSITGYVICLGFAQRTVAGNAVVDLARVILLLDAFM